MATKPKPSGDQSHDTDVKVGSGSTSPSRRDALTEHLLPIAPPPPAAVDPSHTSEAPSPSFLPPPKVTMM
ncbi:hypothetical protein EYF80_059127 [Liparis tanakae]|uniref:Uncharacterized protein n=1 Tax=Liparis tanakae TaxID=230148 RepID=A0A4Z2EQ80_9TELE|nr:hypothetical protein EYF80_059127 [Liparis tanakae]